MRALGTGLVLALIAAAVAVAGKPAVAPAAASAASIALPQAPAAQKVRISSAMNTFSSAADMQALLAKAKAEHKEGQVMVAEHILSLAPYTANLEYRPIDGAVAVHKKKRKWFT